MSVDSCTPSDSLLVNMDNQNNSNFVKSSLAEFISVRSLSLNTKGGKLEMSFNLSLGHPIKYITQSPPTSSSAKLCQRSPAEKERGRQRAARLQASKATTPVPTPMLDPVPHLVLTPGPVFAPAPGPLPEEDSVTVSLTAPVTATAIAAVTSTVVAPVTAKVTP